MPITEEVLDELVGEKKETPTHAAKDTAKEGKEKIHVAKNIMEASKASKEKVMEASKASKEKVFKAAGKAKMNIRKRIDSEKDPERQNSRGQIMLKDMISRDKDDGGGGGGRSAGHERKRDKSERRKDLHLQTSSPPALAAASSSSSAEVQYGGGGGGGPFAFDHAGKKSSVAATVSNNGDVVYSGANAASAATAAIDSLEQVEALIKMKKLPAETVAIHSPESGTTLY